MTYKYAKHKAHRTRIAADQSAEHQFENTTRRDPLIPVGKAGALTYRAECSCGWKDPDNQWRYSLAMAKVVYDRHVLSIPDQPELF
jgi:hypothetical protein